MIKLRISQNVELTKQPRVLNLYYDQEKDYEHCMLIHTVVFWLKKDLSCEELSTFEKEVRSLEDISSVDQLFVGPPASTTKRPVIDDSYNFCLTVVLKDVEAHDAYQEDPLHLEFIKKCSHMWERVKIYDSE